MGGGATVLELSWETVDGYVQRVCVGWVGGVVKDGAMRKCGVDTLSTLHSHLVLELMRWV